MKNLFKLTIPVLLCVVCLTLPSCQTAPAAASSVLTETAGEVEASVCRDLEPGQVTEGQFNTAPQWVRDYLTTLWSVYEVRCD